MPLTIAKEIKVIGNAEDDRLKEYYEKRVILREKVDPRNPICPRCNEKMESPWGMWNGSVDCDDDDIGWKHWSFECKNFHNSSWSEEV